MPCAVPPSIWPARQRRVDRLADVRDRRDARSAAPRSVSRSDLHLGHVAPPRRRWRRRRRGSVTSSQWIQSGCSYCSSIASGPCCAKYSRRRRSRRCARASPRRTRSQDPAHHHAGARRDRRPAVGHDAGVRLRHFDRLVGNARARRRRSARASCGCPGRSRCSTRAPRARAR